MAAPNKVLHRKLSYMPLLETEPQLQNPFVNLTVANPPTLGRKVRRVIVGVTLLPVRLGLTVANLLLGVCLARLATVGLTAADFDALEGQPLAVWRQNIFSPIVGLMRFQLLLLGFWRIRIKGRCASREDAPLIICNHVSGLVEGLFMAKYPKLAEAEYAATLILGPMMKATMAIFVDRADPQSRENSKRALFRRCTESRWPQTVVFPEGCCTNGTAVVQFKMGAFSPGCPVQPVLFRYPNNVDDPSFTFPLGSNEYLLNLLLSVSNNMEVEFLPVYVPSDQEARNPQTYAANVQQYMANALGVPTTKHAAEDVSLCIAAKKLKMPIEAGVVQWQAISETLTGLKVKDAKVLMQQFSKIDKAGTGLIDFPTFAKAMRSKVRSGSIDFATAPAPGGGSDKEAKAAAVESVLSDEELHSIFDLLDLDSTGSINFQEYLCGVAVLNGHGPEDQETSIKWVFDSLAKDHLHFTKEQLDVLLHRAMPSLDSSQLDDLFSEADSDADGLVSREEFIAFAKRHREDLGLNASRLLCGLPLTAAMS